MYVVSVSRLIRYFSAAKSEANAMSYTTACGFATTIIIASLFMVLFFHPYCLICYKTAVKMRVSWSALLYNKSLRLKTTAFEKTTIGQIVNLITNDVNQFDPLAIHRFRNFGWIS
ncbi:unnamed protein product, partial [Medioppia subpectinata]